MTLSWDVVEPTDSGILEELHKRPIRDGEKRLMLAMLENATEDFQKYATATDRRGKELFDAAEQWIMETDSASFFSFETICEHLQLDPSYLRQGFLRWKEAKRNGEVKKCPRKSPRRAA